MTRETITLTQAEQRRVIVLTQVREQRLDAARAAALLGLSLRHCRRLRAAFRREGGAAPAMGWQPPRLARRARAPSRPPGRDRRCDQRGPRGDLPGAGRCPRLLRRAPEADSHSGLTKKLLLNGSRGRPYLNS